MATSQTWNPFGHHAGNAAGPLSDLLAQVWWAIALRGVLAILFGLVALMMPGVTMLSLVFLFAAYALVDGVFAIVSAFRAARARESWGLLVFQGLTSILASAIAVLVPGLTVAVFVLLVAAWAIISGVLMLTAAFGLRIEHGRWWLALSGVASLLYGVLLVAAPLLGAIVLTWWLGAYALIVGGALLVLAFRVRALAHGVRA